jgi:hypothetical protein
MSRRTVATHGHAGGAKLMSHGGRRDAQLGTDLPQGRPGAYRSAVEVRLLTRAGLILAEARFDQTGRGLRWLAAALAVQS